MRKFNKVIKNGLLIIEDTIEIHCERPLLSAGSAPGRARGKEGLPTTHQETKYAHFSLLSS